MEGKKKNLELSYNKLLSSYSRMLHSKKQQFFMNTAKLDAMSPLKVLTRGYSMAKTEEGNVISSVEQVKENDKISVTVRDGEFSAIVCAERMKSV